MSALLKSTRTTTKEKDEQRGQGVEGLYNIESLPLEGVAAASHGCSQANEGSDGRSDGCTGGLVGEGEGALRVATSGVGQEARRSTKSSKGHKSSEEGNKQTAVRNEAREKLR